MTTVLLLSSVALNVVQARKLKRYAEATVVEPRAGTLVPAIQALTLEGEPVSIQFDQPTILYYFGPACGWCQRNWLNVKALIAGTQGRFRFIGLSAQSDVTKYLIEHGLTFEVFTGIGPETSQAFYLTGTPHTIVVGKGGKVLHSWSGAYSNDQQQSIEAALDVILPGLQPSSNRALPSGEGGVQPTK
jgi:hypothetical protein